MKIKKQIKKLENVLYQCRIQESLMDILKTYFEFHSENTEEILNALFLLNEISKNHSFITKSLDAITTKINIPKHLP